ncbi:MAG: hypothetical protein AAF789_01785 [Bacteroidota bacterium]
MKRKKILYSISIVVSLSALLVCFYFFLGGFNEIEVYEAQGIQRTVVGKEYILPNKLRNPEFEKLDEALQYLETGKLKGELTNVIYNDSTLIDSTRFFIGASFDGFSSVVRMPSGYSSREFETEKILQVFITQSTWVRPMPDEVSKKMEKEAQMKGYTLQPLDFEIYYKDGSLRQERWAE